jgi:hypothetical protein
LLTLTSHVFLHGLLDLAIGGGELFLQFFE